MRPGTRLRRGVRVGNFVEVKNSDLGPGTKADHLAYIGDAANNMANSYLIGCALAGMNVAVAGPAVALNLFPDRCLSKLERDTQAWSECGHQFSKAGIDGIMHGRSEIECPVQGCRKMVKRSQLEPDVAGDG